MKVLQQADKLRSSTLWLTAIVAPVQIAELSFTNSLAISEMVESFTGTPTNL